MARGLDIQSVYFVLLQFESLEKIDKSKSR